jgi:hypothetical protein
MWLLLPRLAPMLAPLAWMVITYLTLLRPARKRRRVARLEATKPAPERREPRDTSRPYPKPDSISPGDERLTVCPVCGMEDLLFLDGGPDQGDLMGWPAHATCAEWLGDWVPAPAERPVPEYRYLGSAGTIPVHLGGTVATIFTAGESINRSAVAIDQMTQAANAGMMTMDELRERIVGAFGIPEISITTTSADAGTATCDCGMSFSGIAVDLDRSMEAHRTSGQHEQRMAYLNRRP